MKQTFFALAAITLASGASAHPSLMAHSHPHGVSPLAGIDVFLLLLFALAALGLLAFRRG
jgi:hypothetical protein